MKLKAFIPTMEYHQLPHLVIY